MRTWASWFVRETFVFGVERWVEALFDHRLKMWNCVKPIENVLSDRSVKSLPSISQLPSLMRIDALLASKCHPSSDVDES